MSKKPETRTAVPIRAKVLIADIVQDPLFQVREKLDLGTVNKYANAMKSGSEFPPVEVMRVNGVPMQVDGWHRMAAARKAGFAEILANVTEGTEDDLRWEAAKANLAHGLPLKSKEVRTVFRAYVKSGQHRIRGRRVKPARDIAKDLQGAVHHGTILNWMKSDFPTIYRAMVGRELEPEGGLKGDVLSSAERMERAVYKAVDEITANARGIIDQGRRGAMIAVIEKLLEDLKVAAPWQACEVIEHGSWKDDGF
jgi:hypothetical protein